MATVYDASPFIAEVWNNEAVIDPATLAMNLVTTAETGLAPVGAKTVHVLMAGSFTANDMSSNAVVDQAGSESDVELVMDKHKHVSTLVRDLDELQSSQGVRQRLLMIGGMNQALLKKIDTDFVTALAAISPSSGHTISNSTQADWIDLGATGDTVDEVVAKLEALALNAQTILHRANIVDSNRSYMVAPEIKELLLKSSKYASMDTTGQPNVRDGQFARWFGSPVIMRNDVARTLVPLAGQVPAHTIVTCYHYQSSIMACGIQQQPRLQGQYALENLAWRVVADTVYGFKVAKTEALVKMQYYFVGDPFGLGS